MTSQAWINSADDEENEDDPNPSSQLEPAEPSAAHIAHHNHIPAALQPAGFILRHRIEPGRKYDAQRGSEVPTSRHHPRDIASRWRQFAQKSGYAVRNEEDHHQLVDEEYLAEHEPDFSQGWIAEKHEGFNSTHQRTRWQRIQRTIFRSAFIPLIFRLIVFSFCVIALGLGSTIYRSVHTLLLSKQTAEACKTSYESSKTSSLMAVIIDSAAIIYLFYITWDEYKGLPLGLRSGKAKVLVLLCDLFFIVFSSANVTLAFESIVRPDSSSQNNGTSSTQKCESPNDINIKWKQDLLASTLLVALIAWLMTFAVSVLRYVSSPLPKKNRAVANKPGIKGCGESRTLETAIQSLFVKTMSVGKSGDDSKQ